MNGETYEMCALVSAARKAMKMNEHISYKLKKYVKDISFVMLSENGESSTVKSSAQWFRKSMEQGMYNIFYLSYYHDLDYSKLGFVNTHPNRMVVRYRNGSTSYYESNWEYNHRKKGWTITYRETEWKDAPDYEFECEDTSDEFSDILLKIADFADQIDSEEFACIFRKARKILLTNDISEYDANIPLLPLPKRNLAIFCAASTADVFGAMGSWNDSPQCYAHEKGLDAEYKKLSEELLVALRKNVVFAVDECYK